METTQHLALARKCRPQSFEEVVGQSHIVQALQNSLNSNKFHHACLFTGKHGLGKTTLARLVAKALNCQQGISGTPCGICDNCKEVTSGRFIDLIEVDAASKTKVEDTRELLEKTQYAPTKGRFKIYLIDEVHMLSTHSFNALLKTLEEPPSHVKFLLATTDPQKLPATVLSRCLQFHLTPLSNTLISGHLESILQEQGACFESNALNHIATHANGSMRDALSLLDQALAHGNGEVLANNTAAMLGMVDSTDIHAIVNGVLQSDTNTILQTVTKLAEQGCNFDQALSDIATVLHEITLEQAASGLSSNTDIKQWAKNTPAEDIQLYYQISITGRKDLALAPTARIGLEMTLLRMLSFTPNGPEISQDTYSPSQKKANTDNATQTIMPNNKITATIHQESNHQAKEASISTWHEWAPSLGLTGIANTIVQNSSLSIMNNDQIHLLLNPLQAPILQPHYTDKIQQALSSYLNKPIKLTITAEASKEPTPHEKKILEQNNKKQELEKKLAAEKPVQEIIKTFDAIVVKESITEK